MACQLTGCGGARITPPPHPADPVTIFVTDYGRHSTLLLPDGRGRLVEYAWGDWDWLGRDDRHWYKVITPMFFSRASAFGRKWLDVNPSAATAKAVGCVALLSFPVDRPAAIALRQQLDARFVADANTTLFNREDTCCYAREAKHYWLFYNCNDQTADWLRQIGCRVEGVTTSSKFKLAQ